MSEMIERVARAIARKNTGSGINWPSFVEEARAAIEAMRELTPPMLAAGWKQLKREHLPKLGPGPGFKNAYQAAIDAALSEVEG